MSSAVLNLTLIVCLSLLLVADISYARPRRRGRHDQSSHISRPEAPSTIYNPDYPVISNQRPRESSRRRVERVRIPEVKTWLRSYEMAEALTVTGLADLLRDDEEYTIFAVDNSALNSYTLFQDCRSDGTSLPRRQLVDQLRVVMEGHVIQGRVLSDAMTDNTLLYSAFATDNRHAVRINVFDRRGYSLRTANCVPFERDNLESNGVIHLVHSVLPTVNKSISQLIATHPRLTIFSNLLNAMSLNPAEGPYTVYAPYDEAFSPNLTDQLERSTTRERIDLVRQHISRRVFCSSGLDPTESSAQSQCLNVFNIDGRRMTVTAGRRTVDASERITTTFSVDGAEMIETDLMATDGVVHIIDRVLHRQNESAYGVLNLVSSPSFNTSMFVELIESTGLRREIESMGYGLTVFLPSNAAVQDIAGELENMTSAKLRQLVEYHIVPHALTGSELYIEGRSIQELQEMMQTMNDGIPLLAKEYYNSSSSSVRTVQCAVITQVDINIGCNRGFGHIINAVMRLPAPTVFDILYHDSQFSRLVRLFALSGLYLDLMGYGNEYSDGITLLAPTNAAFDALSPSTLTKLENNKDVARSVLHSHIFRGVICCAGVVSLNRDGWRVSFSRNQQTVTVEQVPVRSCDLMARNGVVHVVDQFIPSSIDGA